MRICAFGVSRSSPSLWRKFRRTRRKNPVHECKSTLKICISLMIADTCRLLLSVCYSREKFCHQSCIFQLHLQFLLLKNMYRLSENVVKYAFCSEGRTGRGLLHNAKAHHDPRTRMSDAQIWYVCRPKGTQAITLGHMPSRCWTVD